MMSILKGIKNYLNVFVCSQTPWQTLENIREAEGSCTYKKTLTLNNKLPEDWIGMDASGNEKSKENLLSCNWGHHKEGESVLSFQVNILKNYPPYSRSITQFDTLLTSKVFYDRRIWRRNVKIFILK